MMFLFQYFWKGPEHAYLSGGAVQQGERDDHAFPAALCSVGNHALVPAHSPKDGRVVSHVLDLAKTIGIAN